MRVVNYNIKLEVDFSGKKYSGIEKIKITDAEKKITLDLNKIDIHKIKVNGIGFFELG